MSFELLIFDPSLVDYQNREEFVEWYLETSEWDDPSVDYGNHEVLSPSLSIWFSGIIETHPPLNGPFAPSNVDDAKADYTFTRDAIYVSFDFDEAQAFSKSVSLASSNNLGIFYVGSPLGEVFAANENGVMQLVHREPL